MKPDAMFGKAISVSDDNISIGSFAKQTKLGRNVLFEFLRKNKVLYRDNGNNVPYQIYVKQKYFVVTQVVKNNHINVVTKITPKGQKWLLNKFPELTREDE